MSEAPWLCIVGLGEDGPDGLPPASHRALQEAEIVMGPPRHLALLGQLQAKAIPWPVPFADGVPVLLSHRGKRVVVLASGDPFWFGAGAVLARHLDPEEWTALPGASCFSLAASRMGWALETTVCRALHAAPFERIRPDLAADQRLIATLRDGASVSQFTEYLCSEGFGQTLVTVFEFLAGPLERRSEFRADTMPRTTFRHPLVVALQPRGPALTCASGRADTWFDTDGQITKRPVRALTLSALAPQPGEHLWDIGGGSGSIAIEWLLSHPSLSAACVEHHPERASRIAKNALRLGQDRLQVITGKAPSALEGLAAPDVIFIGGGLSHDLLTRLRKTAPLARIVANSVTLESDAVLLAAQAEFGGDLLKIELSEPTPIGSRTGWRASYPILQWSFAP